MDLWNEPLGYFDVPAYIDWFSTDYYQLDNSSWEYPQYVLYPFVIYPLMFQHQCAGTVPGAFGSKYNPSFSLANYTAFMVEQAYQYAAWAKNDLFQRITLINPWYWLPYAQPPSQPWYYEVAASAMPPVAEAWSAIGRAIVNNETLTRPDGSPLTPATPSATRMAELHAITEDIRRDPRAYAKPAGMVWGALFQQAYPEATV